MNTQFSFKRGQEGFTLLELLLSMGIFVIISGAAFGLLNTAQKRFQSEGQILSSFQEGRLALDQIVRDVNDAGYPALNQFSAAVPATSYAATPVAWSPTYPTTPCSIGTCTTPGNFDLILEEADSTTGNIEWIHYQLGGATGTTLLRGSVVKAAGDPLAATTAAGVMFPYATNVMNNASAAQIAQINAAYPGTFPGGAPVPIFTYTCDTAGVPLPCTAAGGSNAANNIRDVEVTLIIMTQQRDMQTGQLRIVTLNGRGHRVNPSQ
jgi:prepilin-type N-terminal cleavage/methylation domain-containing protein